MTTKPSKTMKKRLIAVFLVIVLAGVIPLIMRLFQIQVADHDMYLARAVAQQTSSLTLAAHRGAIYDRNMKELAVNTPAKLIYLSPKMIPADQRDAIADKLSETLGVDRNKVYEQTGRDNQYEIVKRKVDEITAESLRVYFKENELKGVYFEEDILRTYPNGELACQLIGFTGTDNQGLTGIEAYYDKYLRGTPGSAVLPKNARGTDMPYSYESYIAPQDGLSLVLTIDEVVQHYLEQNLEAAREKNKVAKGVAGIVMDVNTGEILALSNKPGFNLNDPFTLTDPAVLDQLALLPESEQSVRKQEELNKLWRNRVVSDPYEPGSTFKILTSAIALEENKVRFSDTFNCTGSMKVGKWNIGCWKRAGHGTQTFVEGIQNSCNPVFMQVAAKVGREAYMDYFHAFGFSETTGVDLPGEAPGIYHAMKDFSEVSLATYSFGQTFKITPLQLITAVSAVANGGNLMKPYVVKEMIDANQTVREITTPTVIRQVISKETSDRLCPLLEGVVSEGSAKNAYIKGYHIAGKTGTSEKVGEEKGKYISSFIGFAPANDPKVAVLILMDEPTAGETYGGIIAAPVVGDIFEDILPHLGVEQQFTQEEVLGLDIPVPHCVGKTVDVAQRILRTQGFKSRVEGDGESIAAQVPANGSSAPSGSTIVLFTQAKTEEQTVKVPDVSGLSVQAANSTLANSALNIRAVGAQLQEGSATAASQEPAAGTRVPIGTVVSVKFQYNDGQEFTSAGGAH